MIRIEPGLMVNDHIRLVRPLAKGAMGDVWVARHENLNIEVAVKVIAADHRRNKIAGERFRREAQCAARLRGRHVVRVFDQGGEIDGLAYIVMELLEGVTLRERLAHRQRMPLGEVGILVRHVSRALSEAHRLGIVHRDVKPANIFLANEGDERVIKLLDFGVATRPNARDQKTLTEVGALIGSPNYMSPEQLLNSKGVDRTCDLWALAAVAYRALTGRPPFLGDNVGDIAMAVLEARFPLPTAVDPQLPDSIDSWFVTMLNKDPKKRYVSADEMAAAFDAAGGWDEDHITLKQPRPVAELAAATEAGGADDGAGASSGTRPSSRNPLSMGQPLSVGGAGSRGYASVVPSSRDVSSRHISVAPHSNTRASASPYAAGPRSAGPHSASPHSASPHSAAALSGRPRSARAISARAISAGPHSAGSHSAGSQMAGRHSSAPFSAAPYSAGVPSAGAPSAGVPSAGSRSGRHTSSYPPPAGSVSSMPPSGEVALAPHSVEGASDYARGRHYSTQPPVSDARLSAPHPEEGAAHERLSTPGSDEDTTVDAAKPKTAQSTASQSTASQSTATQSTADESASEPDTDAEAKATKDKPKRWLKTERIPPEAARELRALAKAPPPDERATRRWSRDDLDQVLTDAADQANQSAVARRSKHTPLPVSQTRKRQQSTDSEFVSGSYVRIDRALEAAESSGEHARLKSPNQRTWRTGALWLLLAALLVLAIMTAMDLWM